MKKVVVFMLVVDVYNTSLLFTNSSAYAVLRFFIKNINDAVHSFNWGINTGSSNIQNTFQTNLSASENVLVFIEHTYPSAGAYTITANATTTVIDFDSEQINVTIG